MLARTRWSRRSEEDGSEAVLRREEAARREEAELEGRRRKCKMQDSGVLFIARPWE